MKKLKKQIQILLLLCLLFICSACGDDCSKTYRPEIGVGYVFMYDTINNIAYPVEVAKVTVKNIYKTFGLLGKTIDLETNTYATNAEGRYQVRFVEKGCVSDEETYCNIYEFSCNNENVFGFGFGPKYIENNALNNVFLLDTIKLYK